MVRSSRHGMGISPQKEVRRSVRERTTVYRSLAENQLGNNFEGIYREHTGYTRSGRKCDNRYHEDSSDSERNYETRRTRRRSLRDEEEHITFSRPKRRKIIVSDMSEHDEVVEESHSIQNGNAYERVRPRRNINGSQSPEKLRNEDNSPSKELRVSLREQRIKNRVIIKTEKADEENEDNKNDLLDDEKQSQQEEEEESRTSSSSSSSEEDEEEVQGGQRAHYELRRRNTSPTKQAQQSKRHTLRNRSRPSYKEHDPIKESKRNDLQKAKHQRQNYKRRMCRSDSSSTGSDHESKMRRHEDEHFERRKEASMKKARNRFVPMNLTDNELASSQSVIRERMRQQTGASCSDVDPMEVDTTVGFEDIGGLGSHIKSLKEIVLFPMVYPDVFQNFNIKAPRGVLFYGPPGTGKTLVARALANECSRGNKKVAFFMRKGADCLSKWVGESERQLRILFDQAYAMRPSIIFFDEIDGLAPVRSTRQDQIHSSIVSTLLALMDGLDSRGEVIVIGATNRLDSIDPALRRPGRFDKELKFSLPDSAARQQILKIHTAKWGESQPSAEEIDWIAGNSSGYCGADLKYLCTESVMISLRNQFPHIYLSNDRLKLDLSNFKVSKEHIITAMKKITPASRRDFSIPCRPLDDRTSILLQSGLNNILLNLPAGYRCSRNVEATGSCELEKVVRGLEEPPAISATRLFLTGSRRCPDMGQTSYILPALLSKLDHLPVHCISISKLFTDGRPEEAFATIFQSALRTAAIGPCILLCPSIDEWFKIVPLSVSHMLKISLSQITGFTPILFIASCEGDYDECPEEVTKIFRVQNCLTMAPIPQDIRTQYFKFVCSPALLPPTIFDPSKYPEPEKAVIEDVPVRKLNKEEAEVLENIYEKQLREFRIFIRDQLAKVFRDRRFTPFTEPVTKDVASDYYEIIKKPMCLTQIQQKIDMREYVHPDQFLGDIQLIVDNALEYNPPRDPQGQSIRHNAMSMRDIVEDIFEKEFDEDFVGKLEESARLLIEANIVPKNEKLINLPKGFIRKSKWRVADGFKGNSFTNYTPKGTTPASSANRSVKFRGATYNFSNGKKKQKSKDIVQSIARQLNQTSEAKEKEQETPEQVTPTTPLTTRHLTETETAETRSIPKIEEKTLLIDKEKIDRVVSAAVRKTDWWPVPEMEALAASLSNCIENCRDQWDRRALSADLLRIVEECDYEPSTRQHLQNSTDFSASSP